jgi:hypothetical protein
VKRPIAETGRLARFETEEASGGSRTLPKAANLLM